MTPRKSPRFHPGDLVKAFHWTTVDADFIGPYLVTQQHSSLSGWSYTLLDPRDGGLHIRIGEGLLRPWKHTGDGIEKSGEVHVQIGADKL